MDWSRQLLPPGTATFTRRELMALLAGGAGALAVGPSLLAAAANAALAPTHKRLIVLWLEGGPSQMETFDPKPGTPNGGPTRAVPTDVPGWLFSDQLPQLAKRAQHLAVIRSMRTREGSHARARELVQCGYTPNPTVHYPPLGSIVAHELGDLSHELPAFVQINGAPLPAGYLGVQCSPFVLEKPEGRIENLAYAGGVNPERLDHRDAMVDVLDDAFAKKGGAPAVESNVAQRQRARRLMDSKLLAAFDLTQEKEALRDAYGRNDFGQGVLMARRLLDHGVQAVQVVLSGWDTHDDNFGRTAKLCAQLDPAFAALLDDLKKRKTLDDTLIVCMGEFGRTPEIARGDGRNHWPNNWCVALAGGGIKGGQPWGATDERGAEIADKPVAIADLYATMATALAFDRDKQFHSGLRPIQLVDPNGKVIQELLG